MITVADAFGGPWAANVTGWVLMLGPSVLIVLLEDASQPFSAWWVIGASAVAQHVASGLVSIASVSLLRRRWPQLPVAVAFGVWTVIGVVRGLIGGAIASADGLPADFAQRCVFWVSVSLVWMPLMAYTLAQLDLRRELTASITILTERREAQSATVQRSAEEAERELVAAVRATVAPLVHDVRLRLAEAAEHDTELALAPISARLEAIAAEAAGIIERDDRHPQPAERPRPPWSALAEALTFDGSRPVFATAVTTAAVAAMLVPATLVTGGAREAGEMLAAVSAGGLGLLLALLLLGRLRMVSPVSVLSAFVFSGVLAGAALLAVEIFPLRSDDIAFVVALPLAFASAATVISAAVGLANANIKLIPETDALTCDLAELEARSLSQETAARRQVAQLMHGPLLGRLSACVMALNFYLAEPEQNRRLRRSATVEGVQAHLDLIADDMEQLARSRA